MEERFSNAMYFERQRVLQKNGLSEDEAYDIIVDIKKTETEYYLKDRSLKDRMAPLEQEGKILEIYNNMYPRERIDPFLRKDIDQNRAFEISSELQDAENALIEQYNNEGSLKERRDSAIKEAAECLQELKEYTAEPGSIEDRIKALTEKGMAERPVGIPMSESMARMYACTQYVRNEVFAIPLSREFPALDAAETFAMHHKYVMMDGMSEVMMNERMVETAIQMEQARNAEFTEGVESIQSSDNVQEV